MKIVSFMGYLYKYTDKEYIQALKEAVDRGCFEPDESKHIQRELNHTDLEGTYARELLLEMGIEYNNWIPAKVGTMPAIISITDGELESGAKIEWIEQDAGGTHTGIVDRVDPLLIIRF